VTRTLSPRRQAACAPVCLGDLVGRSCKITRTAAPADHAAFTATEIDGCLLHAPELGQPMLIGIGGRRWTRTSPISDLTVDEHPELVVSVRTTSASYRLVFGPRG
jgi:hypothetical protein